LIEGRSVARRADSEAFGLRLGLGAERAGRCGFSEECVLLGRLGFYSGGCTQARRLRLPDGMQSGVDPLSSPLLSPSTGGSTRSAARILGQKHLDFIVLF
jgi:hypothetical protein